MNGGEWGVLLSALSVPAAALTEKAIKHFVYGGEEGFLAILFLTAPLSFGVAAIFLLWRWIGRDQPGVGVLCSGLILAASTWLGKTLAIGLAVDLDASRMEGPSGMLASQFASGMWTKGIGYLLGYFQFYGPRLFVLATVAGLVIGWNVVHLRHQLEAEV